MGDRELIRASDEDRQQVVDRLRAAVEDGRLKMEGFTERMGLACQAVTHGGLAKLVADLPPASPQPGPRAAPAPAASAASPAAAAQGSVFADLPAALKVLWTIWLAAVSINVVVWVLVVGTSGHFIYPWPLWVAGPYGAALLAISVPRCTPGAAARLRRHSRPRPRLTRGASSAHSADRLPTRGMPPGYTGLTVARAERPLCVGTCRRCQRPRPAVSARRRAVRPVSQPPPKPGTLRLLQRRRASSRLT